MSLSRRSSIVSSQTGHQCGGVAVCDQFGEPRRAAGTQGNGKRKQRLIVMFSPNGIVKKNFWPDERRPRFQVQRNHDTVGAIQGQDADPNGIGDQIKGDGDNHMRGIGCLLTGTELFRATSKAVRTRPPVGERDLDRSRDQEFPPEGSRDPHSLRLTRVRRHGARPRGHLDTHGLHRREQTRLRRSTTRTRCSTNSMAPERSRATQEHPRRCPR